MSRETFQSLRMLLMEKLDLARELTDEEILEELKTEFPALETEIEELGAHIVELENEINDPEVLRDHLLLRDKCDELDDSRFHQQELYDEWEKLAEEQEAFENIPESLQGTERYEVAENAVDMLESASSGLEDVISFLGDAEG